MCLTYNFLGKCNSEWQSKTKIRGASTCAHYIARNYCTETGDYGSGWSKWDGVFENYPNSFGETALVCPQCGCKGIVCVFMPNIAGHE